MKDGRIQVGLLGGTFDPPHKGHLKVAREALKSEYVDQVWFLPCWKHAFGKTPLDFHERVNMCEMMTIKEPNVDVCALEGVIRSTHSVTILSEITKAYPNMDFFLLMGSDNYWKMDKWKDPEIVKQLAPPIWVQRNGYDRPPETETVIECDSSSSSTKIREALKEKTGPEVLIHELHPAVLNYIYQKELY